MVGGLGVVGPVARRRSLRANVCLWPVVQGPLLYDRKDAVCLHVLCGSDNAEPVKVLEWCCLLQQTRVIGWLCRSNAQMACRMAWNARITLQLCDLWSCRHTRAQPQGNFRLHHVIHFLSIIFFCDCFRLLNAKLRCIHTACSRNYQSP